MAAISQHQSILARTYKAKIEVTIFVSRVQTGFKVILYGITDEEIDTCTRIFDLPSVCEVYDDYAQADEYAWQWAGFLGVVVLPPDFDREMGEGE